MADLVDRAQALEELQREDALRRILREPPGKGSKFCRRCGDEIPEDRRKALPEADTCVDCQLIEERERR
jgi:phage/conjugal plasmid C-4 type zinc finger TraR family protein